MFTLPSGERLQSSYHQFWKRGQTRKIRIQFGTLRGLNDFLLAADFYWEMYPRTENCIRKNVYVAVFFKWAIILLTFNIFRMWFFIFFPPLLNPFVTRSYFVLLFTLLFPFGVRSCYWNADDRGEVCETPKLCFPTFSLPFPSEPSEKKASSPNLPLRCFPLITAFPRNVLNIAPLRITHQSARGWLRQSLKDV